MKNKDLERMLVISESLEELKKEGLRYILVRGAKNKVNLETANDVPDGFEGIVLKSNEVTVSILNDAVEEVRSI